jgi:hypothetical protein
MMPLVIDAKRHCDLQKTSAHHNEHSRVFPQQPKPEGALMLHAASSTTNTERYCDLFEATVLPYWQADPPRARLTTKPYKSVWAKNAVLPEHSLTFKVRSMALRVLRGASRTLP